MYAAQVKFMCSKMISFILLLKYCYLLMLFILSTYVVCCTYEYQRVSPTVQ